MTLIAERPRLELDRRAPELPPVVTTEQHALIKATIAKDATEAELQLFLYDCARQGVHPLDKLLHFTKRGGKYTPVTSIDLMRMRAAESGDYAGNDAYEFAGTPGRPGFTATARVWRLVQGQRVSFTRPARWEEYCPPQGQDHMWRKMPHVMLGKCAEAQALRVGFPRQLHGLYAAEELESAPEDVTPPPRRAAPPAKEPPAQVPGLISPAQAKRLWAIAKRAGWTEPEVKALLQKAGVEHTADVPAEQYDAICAALEAGVDATRAEP